VTELQTGTTSKTVASHVPRLGILLLAALWLVWGTSWPAMRVVFLEIPVWQYRAVSCFIGALGLLAIAVATSRGNWRVPREHWAPLAAAATFNITMWHVLVGYGLSLIGAGHAVIACYTLPIWTALLGTVFLKERLTWRIAAALALGLGGILALFSSDFETVGTNPVGLGWVLASAVAWAIGTIIMKRVAWRTNMIAIAGWQLLIGAIPIAVVAALTERFVMFQASATALWSTLYLVFAGLIAGYGLWFKIVTIFPATVASIGALMIPIVGVVSGAIVLGEPVSWPEALALVLVLAAVALVLLRPAAPPKVVPAKAGRSGSQTKMRRRTGF
jgi:drug/metabolite transporter (DMT)-like permease